MKVTSTGAAKDLHPYSMGTYEFYKLGEKGKEIFKWETVGYGKQYLYFSSNGFWMVRNTTMSISLFIISIYFIVHYLFHKILNYI